MSKKVRALRNSLPAICKAVTKQKGIKLVFQGPPRTDGRVIYSNPLPINADGQQTTIIVGDIDHECGHILFTDFDISHVIRREKNPELVHLITNSVEDTFIERRLGEMYPGCRTTLSDSVIEIEKKESMNYASMPPQRQLAMFIDAYGRVNVLKQPLQKSLEAATHAVQPFLGDKMAELTALLDKELANVDSTKESFELAKKLMKFLEETVQQQQQPEPQQDESGQGESGQGESGQGESGQDESGQGESGQDESGQGESGQEQPIGNGGNGASDAPAAPLIENDPTLDTTPVFDRREAKEEAVEEATANSMVMPQEQDYQPPGENLPRYQKCKDDINGQIKRLQRNLVNEYQTRTRRRSVISDEGRIDGRRLAQVAMGNTRVFRQKQHRTLPYPAVTVLIDVSGSMHSRMNLAQQALISIAETNNSLNVQTEILAFEGMRFCIPVKPFNEPLNNKTKGRIGALHAGGGTPTADALWIAGNRLMARKEERRLLLLVTDGAPNDIEAAKEVAQMIERSPIELYGLEIGDGRNVSRFITHTGAITEASEIAEAVLTAIRQRILKAA